MADEADGEYGVTVAKRRLSRRLAAMRRSAGLSVADVSGKLGWARGRLQRIEASRWRLPDAGQVRDLARIYGASAAERDELAALAVRARARPWWRSFEDVYGTDEFPGYEADASRISLYAPLVIPELLQTRPYAEAHMAASSHRSRAWQERALQARLKRQQILDRAGGTAPAVTAVITEASLLYKWGTPGDRRDQLARLITAGQRPGWEIRLLRLNNGPHPGMISTLCLLDFPGDTDPGIVYLTIGHVPQEVTQASQARAYRNTLGRIREAALGPDATRTHLESFADAVG